MRRRGLLALLAGPALVAQAPGPVFPPGSSVGLVPPAGMRPASSFAGFQDEAARASILVAELPAEAYAALSKVDDAAFQQRQGLKVARRRSLTVAGAPAVLLTGTQPAGGVDYRKWVLIAGPPALTALVTMQVPVGASAGAYPDRAVEAALATVTFRPPPVPADALAALPFALGDMAGLRVVRTFAGSNVLLTDGPLDVDKESLQPLLVVTWQRQPEIPPELREAFARRKLGAARLRDPDFADSETLQVHGGDLLLTEATGADADSGRAMYAFQALRFTPDGLLQTLGLVRAEAREATAPRFRQVALSAAPR